MTQPHRFLVSYICDNQPTSLEISSENDSLDVEEAERQIKLTQNEGANIADIRIVSLHHDTNPDVHPGHYQQPEG